MKTSTAFDTIEETIAALRDADLQPVLHIRCEHPALWRATIQDGDSDPHAEATGISAEAAVRALAKEILLQAEGF